MKKQIEGIEVSVRVTYLGQNREVLSTIRVGEHDQPGAYGGEVNTESAVRKAARLVETVGERAVAGALLGVAEDTDR